MSSIPHILTVPSGTADSESVILAVHGTFAGAEQDAGQDWWQAGSPVMKRIQAMLPPGIRVARKAEVFHWSGHNSERARSKAARQLLQQLQAHESAGRTYHLVGHSHGGSVIWQALKIATLRSQVLHGLQSWTTVGTPFLQHQSRSAWNPINLLGLLFGILLIKPVIGTIWSLVKVVIDTCAGEHARMTLPTESEAGYTAILRAPILSFLERLGVSVDRQPDGIHLGHYDPDGGLSELQYLLTTTEGLVLLVTTLATIYVFLHLSLMCMKPAIESYRIRCEQRLQRQAFQAYGSKWLGIWSPHDEAINGLRATLDLSISFVGKMLPHERVFWSDVIGLFSRPYFWVIAPLFNRLIHPPLDQMIRNMVTRSAQGNDLPTATLTAVTASPLETEAGCAPAIPASVDEKLLSYADSHARDIAPHLRQLLSHPSFTAGLESFATQLSGKELIHTSYFRHSSILHLISAHVAMEDSVGISARAAPLDAELADWLWDFKTGLDSERAIRLPQTRLPTGTIRPRKAA